MCLNDLTVSHSLSLAVFRYLTGIVCHVFSVLISSQTVAATVAIQATRPVRAFSWPADPSLSSANSTFGLRRLHGRLMTRTRMGLK